MILAENYLIGKTTADKVSSNITSGRNTYKPFRTYSNK
jgi:hypothetical protein